MVTYDFTWTIIGTGTTERLMNHTSSTYYIIPSSSKHNFTQNNSHTFTTSAITSFSNTIASTSFCITHFTDIRPIGRGSYTTATHTIINYFSSSSPSFIYERFIHASKTIYSSFRVHLSTTRFVCTRKHTSSVWYSNYHISNFFEAEEYVNAGRALHGNRFQCCQL